MEWMVEETMNTRKLLFIGISITAVIIILFLFLIFSFKGGSPAKNLPTPSVGVTGVTTPSVLGFQLTSSTPQNKAVGVQLNTPISFLFNKEVGNATATITPTTNISTTFSGRAVIIKPNTNLSPSTQYVVVLEVNSQSFFLTFTTQGPTPTMGQNTRPIDQVDAEQEILKQTHPDVFLSNYTPYTSSTISITSAYTSGNPGHFQFTVSSRGNAMSATAEFQSWAQQKGLNNSQLASLDVVYK
jgi:hypothetical protein